MYYCIINDRNVMHIKKSKFFKQNLGMSATKISETSGVRELNLNNFEKKFYETYNMFVYKRGNIANISIYSTPAIKDDYITFFNSENKELSLEFDMDKYTNIDSYLGMCVMELTKYFNDNKNKPDISENNTIISETIEYILNKIKNEPYAMTWKELQLYKKISGTR